MKVLRKLIFTFILLTCLASISSKKLTKIKKNFKNSEFFSKGLMEVLQKQVNNERAFNFDKLIEAIKLDEYPESELNEIEIKTHPKFQEDIKLVYLLLTLFYHITEHLYECINENISKRMKIPDVYDLTEYDYNIKELISNYLNKLRLKLGNNQSYIATLFSQVEILNKSLYFKNVSNFFQKNPSIGTDYWKLILKSDSLLHIIENTKPKKAMVNFDNINSINKQNILQTVEKDSGIIKCIIENQKNKDSKSILPKIQHKTGLFDIFENSEKENKEDK